MGQHDLNAGMQAVAATDRNDWARSMRARFSPPAMLNDDASINQTYFRPHQARSDMQACPTPPALLTRPRAMLSRTPNGIARRWLCGLAAGRLSCFLCRFCPLTSVHGAPWRMVSCGRCIATPGPSAVHCFCPSQPSAARMSWACIRRDLAVVPPLSKGVPCL